MGAGVGAVAQIGGEMAGDKLGFVRSNWYGQPLLLAAGAMLLVKRRPNLAYALAGAAGYAGAFNYKLNQFQQGRRSTSPVPLFGTGAAVQQLAPAAVRTGDYDGYGQTQGVMDAVGF
jgi:hypothetical protein